MIALDENYRQMQSVVYTQEKTRNFQETLTFKGKICSSHSDKTPISYLHSTANGRVIQFTNVRRYIDLRLVLFSLYINR